MTKSSTPGGDEHRQHPRVPVRERVWCEGDHVTLYVQALNFSAGGLFVRAPSPPEPGERLRVTFAAEDGPIVARTEVVWRKGTRGDDPGGMGLRILGFDEGEERFSEFVARHLESHKRGVR